MAIDSATQTTSLAPGFRFHPTDEELVRYYLRRKICGKSFRFDAISDTDIYKCEPWDLPGKSRLKSRDLEWYFFTVLDKKHGNGSKTNRATDRGYWKTTGKDRAVLHRSRTVGMKKTLVFHSGRAPCGERTNWVMHEYRLTDEELEKAGIVQDAYVLCRIFRKSGSGPKNGEQYGAPFIEEEWENDNEPVLVPREGGAEELVVGDDAFLDENDVEQILAGVPLETAPVPSNYYVDFDNYVEESKTVVNDAEKLSVGISENHGLEQLDGQKVLDLPAQNDLDAKSVENECIGESSNPWNPELADYLLDEPFFDAINDQPFDGEFIETDDLSNTIEADPSGSDMLEEYLTFFDADDGSLKYMDYDSSKMVESENPVSDQASLTQMVNGETYQGTWESQQLLEGCNNAFVASSNQEPEKSKSATKYLFNQASRMLGSIPAPPAYASEFPTKNAILQLNAPSQSSSSVHFTAGMIHLRNLNLSGIGTNLTFDKLGNVNVVLSLGLSYTNVNSASLEPMASISNKDRLAMSRGWFYLIVFMWVLILLISFKIGSYIYSGCAH
ncbi:NAC domain-containing protein 78-like [Cornus florida]|uniref:NAC domain-containing protein 78-like n=1 Tax=Cornus florida TaxID=4283 RepID=UPI00289AF189|nr:NAC domain-containing protein 78-like [Cornus florida]